MRLLADENISRLIVQALLDGGFDVVTVADTLPGASDLAVLEHAWSSGLGLLTEDRDFGELVIRQRHKVHALILIELDGLSPGSAALRMRDALGKLSDNIKGQLVVVEPARVRLRPLAHQF